MLLLSLALGSTPPSSETDASADALHHSVGKHFTLRSGASVAFLLTKRWGIPITYAGPPRATSHSLELPPRGAPANPIRTLHEILEQDPDTRYEIRPRGANGLEVLATEIRVDGSWVPYTALVDQPFVVDLAPYVDPRHPERELYASMMSVYFPGGSIDVGHLAARGLAKPLGRVVLIHSGPSLDKALVAPLEGQTTTLRTLMALHPEGEAWGWSVDWGPFQESINWRKPGGFLRGAADAFIASGRLRPDEEGGGMRDTPPIIRTKPTRIERRAGDGGWERLVELDAMGIIDLDVMVLAEPEGARRLNANVVIPD